MSRKGTLVFGGLEEFVFSSTARVYYGLDPDQGRLFVRVVLLHGSTSRSTKAQNKEVLYAAGLWSHYLADPKARRRGINLGLLAKYQ